MDPSAVPLQSVLLLLAAAVLAVALCRSLRLPPVVGYLAVGLLLGPHATGLMAEREEMRRLAEFGVIFLMFSIGLEFSLPKLAAMRRVVFGLGLTQVAVTLSAAVAASVLLGAGWQAGIALGGIVAMSSTAIVSKLLADRGELDSVHGRQVIGVLLFQDLAVVPLLVLIPALGQPADAIGAAIAVALAKALAALALVVVVGPRVMRAWLGAVARRRSNELFVLNVLLITLLLAFLTGLAGLSLVLGAFLAGMLIAETEYRFQVEEDIKPFRDVLLGLFFVTVGMMLDLRLVLGEFARVIGFLLLVMLAKGALIAALARAFGASTGSALRAALALGQAGEFGFVLLPLAGAAGLLPEDASPRYLSTAILAALQGGLLLTQTYRSIEPLEAALDTALTALRAIAGLPARRQAASGNAAT